MLFCLECWILQKGVTSKKELLQKNGINFQKLVKVGHWITSLINIPGFQLSILATRVWKGYNMAVVWCDRVDNQMEFYGLLCLKTIIEVVWHPSGKWNKEPPQWNIARTPNRVQLIFFWSLILLAKLCPIHCVWDHTKKGQ